MDSQEARSEKGLSRRGLLAAASGGAATLAVERLAGPAAAFAGSGDELGPSINGTVKEASGSDTLVIENIHSDLEDLADEFSLVDGSELELAVAGNAALWRSGPVGLEAFQPGDRVIAYVTAAGGQLSAQAVEPLYTAIEGIVSSRKDDQLVTDQGSVVLSDSTLLVEPGTGEVDSAKSLSEIGAGSRIFATCRYDPPTGMFVANTIGAV